MVDHRVATRLASDLGVPLSRQTGFHDEQHRMAARSARRSTTAVRIHDLRHTFGCRLRAAGVPAEDRDVLLGHANHSMAGHYASADVGRLLKQANLVLNREETRTVLRIANADALWIKGPARVRQDAKRARSRLVSP
jgi:integrase